MVIKLILSSTIVLGLAQLNPVQAQKVKQNKQVASKTEVKFLDDISVDIATPSAIKVVSSTTALPAKNSEPELQYFSRQDAAAPVENATDIQLKYSILLDTEVEFLRNVHLFKTIDEWFGTRYRYGGNSKDGVDCSAFVQNVFTDHYNLTLPRTAREQYEAAQKISMTEIKEGDLVFFNTTGGVSHVGIYLQNNKFVHAATSEGVTISDLYDNYWVKRFVGAGRLEKEAPAASPLIFSSL